MTKTFKAVICAFTRYEAERGLPKDFIRTVNATNPLDNAWAKLEQSQVTAAEFDGLFREESRALGHEVSGAEVLTLLSGSLRPRVVNALTVCKGHGRVGCITNNAPVGKGASMTNDEAKAQQVAEVFAMFDPRIYALMCEALDVDPADCVYLDDIGHNLKPARDMGMTTIKVLGEDQLLSDLQAVTGYALA